MSPGKHPILLGVLALSAILLITGRCGRQQPLPLGPVPFPADNPMSEEKIELGRRLFFDKRLSADNTVSCADCHRPEKAFTDGRPKSSGIRGGTTVRNAPSLLNCGYLPRLMFDGELKTLEVQVIVPLQEHTEMGSDMRELIMELRGVPEYEAAAQRIFGRTFDPWVLTRSIAAFERTLVSQNSAYDRFMSGDASAMTASQQRGLRLFTGKLYCASCHPAPHFTTFGVANNGLYNDYGEDQGRFRVDHLGTSRGAFKVPSLRNVALTGPYMHDGSLPTLEAVIGHYASGGKGHANQAKAIVPFRLSARERKDLLNFFDALTDTSYLRDFQ